MTKPSAWRAFLRPAGHRLPETSCAGRAPHGLSQPPDMPNRDRSTPYRPPCTASAFPAKAFPSRSIPARVSDRPASPRHSGPTTRQQPPGSPTSPSGIAAGIPKHAFTSRHPHKTFLRTKSVPPCGVPAARLIKELPRRIRLFIAGRPRPILPEVFQRPGSKRESKRDRKIPALFTLQPSPSFLPGRMACPISNRRQPTTGTGARPEESFFGDEESTRGEGAVFTKNAPSLLVTPLLHGLSPTKKAGQLPAPAFTGKTKKRG